MNPITFKYNEKISLFHTLDTITAEISISYEKKIHFHSNQVHCGILGKVQHKHLIDRIKKLGGQWQDIQENIAIHPFPKENPQELWIFEANKGAATCVLRGKNLLKEIEAKQKPRAPLVYWESEGPDGRWQSALQGV